MASPFGLGLVSVISGVTGGWMFGVNSQTNFVAPIARSRAGRTAIVSLFAFSTAYTVGGGSLRAPLVVGVMVGGAFFVAEWAYDHSISITAQAMLAKQRALEQLRAATGASSVGVIATRPQER